MTGNQGGARPGAGRKSGSKNKMTIAREAVAVIINADDPQKLASAIHQRGHELLSEMERIALDPTQPVAARIMAAKTALPFMLPKQSEPERMGDLRSLELVRRIQIGRERAALSHDVNTTI